MKKPTVPENREGPGVIDACVQVRVFSVVSELPACHQVILSGAPGIFFPEDNIMACLLASVAMK